ncbi:MAG: glutaredoxin 3 [Gammaproteobacteria bacterium]|jgi:glutaredoxin 3|nr:glutaredoxin 3 [Gammaproteobacteria bacterium]
MAAEVTVYSSDLCGFCYRAKRLLDSKQVVYAEIKVDGDREKRREMMRLTGAHTVPQIIINGQPVGGCDELYALQRDNQLDTLLG